MMGDREKLIELSKILLNSWTLSPESMADFLLSNGVTVQKPIDTNADRIRFMSDEELGIFLGEWAEKPWAWKRDGEGECLAWLKEPAEEFE